MANRLFLVRPDRIVEHPPELPVDAAAIPDGLIEGWELYAPNFDGDRRIVIGPIEPWVQHETHPPHDAYIEVQRTRFYFRTGAESLGASNKPHWHQSGSTLRFIKARVHPT